MYTCILTYVYLYPYVCILVSLRMYTCILGQESDEKAKGEEYADRILDEILKVVPPVSIFVNDFFQRELMLI